MRNGGAAHKHIEAPQSIDGGDARRWYVVASHARLPPTSGSFLISSFFSLSNLFIPHNKKRGKNTILPDYIVGDERISADIPKKRGWTFIYFIKINNAKEAQKADGIGIHLPLCSKNTR